MGEVVAVAAALGHDLATDDAPDPVAAALRMADAQPAGATTSMQRDIASGLPSEFDAQLGAGDAPVAELEEQRQAALEARVLERVLALPASAEQPEPVSPLPTQLRWSL